MPTNTTAISVSNIDINHMIYGNFIGLQYVFEYRLDHLILQRAIEVLLEQFPILTGQINRKTSQIIFTKAEPKLRIQKLKHSHIHEHSEIGTIQSDRRRFISEPDRKTVFKGHSPLATFTLTNFKSGCIFAVAINHVITDASGFHKVTQQLSKIYTALCTEKPIPDWPYNHDLSVFNFGTNRSWPETLAELKCQNLNKPMKLGRIGQNLVFWAMRKISTQNRMVVYLSKTQVAQLKRTVLTESEEDWISTNAAICAHFSSVLISLIHGDKREKSLRIGQLLDLRSRYFDDPENHQIDFIGNAILIHTQLAQIESFDRGHLARFFKHSTTQLSADFLKSRLDVIADCLRHGRTYPGLEFTDPLLAVNNQTKMPVYDLNFAGQSPKRVIPQDVGDNIMFFPAPDGGMEVYIRDILNPKRQAQLETPEWQARLYDF